MLLASSAVAQSATPVTTGVDAQATAEQPVVTLPSSDPESGSSDDKDVVVTGSRIKRSTFNSASPIAIIDPEVAEKRGVFDTAELLQSSPIASGSSQVTSAISSNFVTDGGPGAATISLRGLGADRTLVLLNSRRAGPAGTRGAVSSFDLNVLPQSIIQEVQIEKDGASSVYGSDAVAGVVNIITKTKTKGLELSAFGSAPQEQGGDQWRLSGAWGKEWGGSLGGHVLLAADYYKQLELAQKQRKYLNCPEDYVNNPSGRRTDLINPLTGSPRCSQLSWGQVYLYDYGGDSVLTGRGGYSYPGENLGRYVPNLGPTLAAGSLGVPSNFYQMGYDPASGGIDHLYNPIYGDATVIPQTKRLTFYGDASMHLGEHVEVYAEGLWNRRDSYQNGFRQFWDYQYTEGLGGPTSGFTGIGVLSPTPITDHSDSSQKVTYWRAVGGLRGDFGSFLSGWTWDGYVQYSKSSGFYTSDQIYKDAIDQQTAYGLSGAGDTSCVGDVTAVRGAPCVDINWTDPNFLAGNLTQAQRNYLFGAETGHTNYTQINAELSVTGNLFKLPAGNVGFAAGITWRRDSIYDRPGDITYALIAGDDPSNPASYTNNSWGNTSSGITAGHNITKEAFVELDVPVIYNTPFIQEFTLSASGRLTDTKATRLSDGASYGDNGNWTYKFGANWKVNPWLRFRATYGTSFRAPALFEQFLANQSSFISQRAIDPCINWGTNLANQTISQNLANNCAADGVPANYVGGSATATVVSGGGLGVVRSETSNARTASIILTPKFDFLPQTKINLAVDYFRFEVNGEISQLGAANIVSGCYNSNFFATEPLCKLFTRQTTAPVHAIATVHDSFINVDKQINEGVDVTGNINQDLGTFGKLAITAEMTWQAKDVKALFGNTAEDFNGRNGEPKWTGQFNAEWSKGTFSVYYGLNVIGGSSDYAAWLLDNPVSSTATLPANCRTSTVYPNGYCEILRAHPTFYHSASVTKKFPGFQVTMGVTNLFNTSPPRVSTYGNGETSTYGSSVFSSQYDLIGRRGFVSVKANF